MKNRFTYTLPVLNHYELDTSRNWFVSFSFKDILTGHEKRLQFRGGINRIKNKEQRLIEGRALAKFWKLQLEAGWNPFGTDLPKLNPTIPQAFDAITDIKFPTIGKRTAETYKYVTKLFKEWIDEHRMSSLDIGQLDASHARHYMDYLTLTKKYSGRTFNDHLTVLSTYINAMIDRDWIAKNPFKKIRKNKIDIGRNIAFSDDERKALSAHLKASDIQLYYFTQFIYYAFIRRSELTRLKIGNIDTKNWTIVVPSHVSKNRKQESVVIPEGLKKIIKEMKLPKQPDWFLFGRGLMPSENQYINYNHISTRHNNVCRELGIGKEKGLYSWRHSGACFLYPLLNGDMYALMRHLRHSDLTTTQIYLKSLGLTDNIAIRTAKW